MYRLKIKNQNGDILNLTENNAYDVLKVEGLNPPPASLNYSEISNYDGSIYNSGRLENRNIVLTIKIHNPAEENRIALYKYFQMKKVVRIYYENNTRSVYIDGRIETFECDYFSINETVQISIICNDPYWKEDQITEIEFSRVISLFEFPMDIPPEGIEFSRIETLLSTFINNSEIETGVTIEFRANTNHILNPKFINRTTQEFFKVIFDMNKSDVIRINTRRGNKSVTLIRNGIETNIINNMVRGSSWIQLAPGTNELSYECDEGAENLSVYLSTYKCYEGV